jgi:hypothetical protein
MEEDKNKIGTSIDKVDEPFVEYKAAQNNRVTFFNSFEEAAQADYEFYRNLTHEQRLAMHYELSIHVFGAIETNPNRRFSF